MNCRALRRYVLISTGCAIKITIWIKKPTKVTISYSFEGVNYTFDSCFLGIIEEGFATKRLLIGVDALITVDRDFDKTEKNQAVFLA